MIVLTVAGLIGLILFVVFALLWLLAVPRRAMAGPLALVGLVIWAITAIIAGLIALL